jgi:HTH-type transcriptional repressor of NAD biosynthesis genes
MTALVVGKFYPPHLGHNYVIDTAIASGQYVVVVICPNVGEDIDPRVRRYWLESMYPAITVEIAPYTDLADDDSEGWAAFIGEFLDSRGYASVQEVFGSEDYVEPFAKGLGAVPHMVDKERKRFPVSARFVRANSRDWMSFLHPVVASYYVPRIRVVGAESTGTTTLAQAIAAELHVPWVPEYGRLYSEARIAEDMLERPWRMMEFLHIQGRQSSMEEAAARLLPDALVCDTDVFATCIWAERFLNVQAVECEKVAEWEKLLTHPDHVLYVITGDEIPFEQDGTRTEDPEMRSWMDQRFQDRLTETERPYIYVRGTVEERLAQIDSYLT